MYSIRSSKIKKVKFRKKVGISELNAIQCKTTFCTFSSNRLNQTFALCSVHLPRLELEMKEMPQDLI